MKTCKYCGEERDDGQFQVAVVKKGKIYKRLKCTVCKIETQSIRKRETRNWLNEIKRKLKCEVCGYSDFRALVFHHRNPKEKDINLSDALRHGWSIKLEYKKK